MKIPARELKTAILLALGLKAAALLILAAGWFFIPRADWGLDSWMTRPNTSFVDNLANFDGAWFVRLAALGPRKLASGEYDLAAETKRLRVMDQLGYEQGRWPKAPGEDRFDRGYGYRHWPLLPGLIATLHSLGLDPVLAGVIISNLFTIVYGVLLYLLARLDLDEKASMFCVALAFLHPGGYSLTGVYNESLFLTFAAGAMLAARSRRFVLAGLLGLLAAQTRICGLYLAVPLAYEWLEQNAERRFGSGGLVRTLSPANLGGGLREALLWPGLWWTLLIPVGFASVLIYFQWAAGDPWVFTKVHETNIHGSVNWPWLMLAETYRKGPVTAWKELPLHLLLLIIIILSFRRVRGSYWVWMVVFFFYHTTNGNHSYLRYQVQCAPLFISLAAVMEGREALKPALLAAFAGLFGVFAAMYINGYWVA